MKKFLLSIVLLCAAALPLAAQTINASDCTQTAVQTAFNSITASTTLVNIPAGSCTWTSPVSLTVPSGSAGLTVQGQTTCTGDGRTGTLACTDNTNIHDGMTYTSTDPPLLSISTQGRRIIPAYRDFGCGNGNLRSRLTMAQSPCTEVRRRYGSTTITYQYQPTGDHYGGRCRGVYDHNLLSLTNAGVMFHIIGAVGTDYGRQHSVVSTYQPWPKQLRLL